MQEKYIELEFLQNAHDVTRHRFQSAFEWRHNMFEGIVKLFLTRFSRARRRTLAYASISKKSVLCSRALERENLRFVWYVRCLRNWNTRRTPRWKVLLRSTFARQTYEILNFNIALRDPHTRRPFRLSRLNRRCFSTREGGGRLTPRAQLCR